MNSKEEIKYSEFFISINSHSLKKKVWVKLHKRKFNSVEFRSSSGNSVLTNDFIYTITFLPHIMPLEYEKSQLKLGTNI